jgi:hypothetical protein
MAKERQFGEQSRRKKAIRREHLSKRRMVLESLEDRRLMTVNPDAFGWFYPPIGNETAKFSPGLVSKSEYATRSAAQYGPAATAANLGSGENNAPFSTTELEPNNLRSQAQLVPLGTAPGNSSVVTVSGQVFTNIARNSFDEDYFAADLRAGDIIEVALNGPTGSSGWDVSLADSRGSELIGSTINNSTGLPLSSPLSGTLGLVTFSTVIPSNGRYFIRVGDGNSAYTLRMRAFRNSIEAEPIGTKQIVFLDFDGATFNAGVLGVPRTVRLPSMMDTLAPLGFTANQENEIIDKIITKVREDFFGSLPSTGGNGYFSADGRPGAFDLEIRNSRDHADPWGLPNVSRVIIGGSSVEFPIPVLGIAESVDIGNFSRTETALVLPGNFFYPLTATPAFLAANDPRFIPRSPSSSLIDIFTSGVALTISHETGHYYGMRHQSATNAVITTMDQGGVQPESIITYGVGTDGVFGTVDDVDIDFGRDTFDIAEGLTGAENQAFSMAYTLGTGTVGSTITGITFNDRNRNGRQDAGDEGLAGWTVFADINGNNVFDSGDTSTQSLANGTYSLSVPNGTFNIRPVVQPNWVIASPAAGFARVASGGTANFGLNLPSPVATGYKWLDTSGDGVRDAGEPGLAGVYMYLDLDGDDRPDLGEPSAITNADGSYILTPPGPGNFTIREVVEAGFVQTYPPAGEHTVSYNGSTPLRGFDFGNVESSDWGDAPSPYPTTRAANGASHGATPGLRLGTNFDSDSDGRPSANADGDDTNGLLNSSGVVIDDEDGVIVLAPIVRGDNSNVIQVTVTNTIGAASYIQGWIDFNGNGSWSDAGEQIATNVLAVSGANNITFATPSSAVGRTFARFRLSQDQNLAPTGKSKSGEVEDYVFDIVNGPRVLLQPDTFTVARNSTLNRLDVLANDFQIQNDPWTITNAGVASNNGRIIIAADGKSLSYSPALAFVGRDEFTYTARSLSGRVESTTVVVNVSLQFNNPVAVDDSFDVPTNSIGFPLSVLANDVEGQGGALIVSSVTNPDKGGSVSIGSGGQSIRYTPRRGFGGTEQFSYTATDATGKTSTAIITVHTVQGDRADDEVEFSFQFLNANNEPITEIRQGSLFKVVVFVDDLRPEKAAIEVPPRNVTDPGVYSAYLDVLYSTGLVTPNAPKQGSTRDFAVTFVAPYQTGISGSAATPGLINELGAFIGSVTSFNEPNKLPVAILEFTASSAGIAEFVGDPADDIPNSEVTFYNTPTTRVLNEQIRFGRATLEVVPSGVNFPFAVDDSRFNVAAGSPYNVDVLTNDVTGTQPPIRISSITQPANGQTTINNNNTPNNFADDTITYVSVSNYAGLDQFKYTITDDRGFISTATVTLHVGAGASDDFIQLRLNATDLSGTPIDQIVVGQQFQLRGYVEDLRTGALKPGVFAAFQDILYDTRLVSVNPSATDPFFQVAYANAYNNGKSGDIRIPGVINEIGSVQSDTSNPTGLGEKLQFIVTLTARNTGRANFLGDPADIKPFHDSLVFEPTTPLTTDQIRYLSDSIQIVATSGGSGSSGGEGNTNRMNAYDVNNDGFVSPIDVLILVNSMNTGSSGLLPTGAISANGESGTVKYFLDVNADNYLSPLDALMVINHLNDRNIGGAEGEAAPLVGSVSTNNFKVEKVEVPFLKKRASSSDELVYGPLPTSDDFAASRFMDEFLLSEDDEEEEADYLDGIAGDVFKNS